VIGISHSRNFGSQAAFLSGMELASKRAVVLMDGDLQDPPEIIPEFFEQWKQGYDVIYGRRVKRDASAPVRWGSSLFYRILNNVSSFEIPRDAGDFSLMDGKVVRAILQFPERDTFLRGLRAYAGFKQTGVDYVRPKRPFGESTNSIRRLFWWARKGILSFTQTPLDALAFVGAGFVMLSVLGIIALGVLRALFPDSVPEGVTTTLMLVMFFGALNLFAVAVVGQYIGRIFEEVKQRPHYFRRAIIRDGEAREVPSESRWH
jgi:dolichol-phosphate mannosyltransferase